MKGYNSNIEDLTRANENFRKVLYTAKYSQLVLMSLKLGEDIGEEVHGQDQFFRIEAGEGKAKVDETEYDLSDGSVVIVPAGAKHNITNTSTTDALKLYTIYSIPHHHDGTVHVTKAEALADHEEFDGHTSE